MKSVQIRSSFWSVFFRIRTRKNPVLGHFSHSTGCKGPKYFCSNCPHSKDIDLVRFVLRNILKSLQKRKLKTETFFCCSNKITLCTIPLGEFNQSCFSRKIHSLMQRKTALCLYLHDEMNKSITHRKYGLYSI